MTELSEIVRAHAKMVRSKIYRIVGDHDDADDCLQEVFVTAIEFSRDQTVENWPALLTRFATVQALECVRRKYRKSEAMTSSLESDPVHECTDDPMQAAEEQELLVHFRNALAQITQNQAEAFCLFEFEDFSYKEVADALGVSEKYVGQLLHRARENLRKRLNKFRSGRRNHLRNDGGAR